MLDTSNFSTSLLCQQYLNIVYHSFRAKKSHQSPIEETYGEILLPGVDKLLSSLALTEKDVFVDLGSGMGKIVMYVFLMSVVKEVCGIEIIPALHQQAFTVNERIKQELPAFYRDERQVKFVLGDFLTFPLTTATVALICSQCYSQATLHALGDLINHSPTIHTVLSLRPLATLKRLPFKEAIRIECSWDTALCYVYRK